MASNFYNWNWTFVCPTGLTPWQPQDKYLAPCFQQICLQLPVLALFAITSAYYFGNQTVLVRRNWTQKWLIYLRVTATLMLILLPIYKTFMMINEGVQIWPIDILLNSVEIVTWTIHLGFLLALRNHGDVSHRGPLFIVVIWLSLALLACVWLRSSIMLNSFSTATAAVVLLGFYGLSLVFNGSATYVQRRNVEDDERQNLIGSTYIRFRDDVQIEALGQASDDAPCLSKLIFHWVNPLIEKGLTGNLKRIDDLFDLPESLSINNTIERLHNALTQTMSLCRALHRVFGWEFYSIGLLRFSADMLGFSGPLLLAALLSNQNNDKNGTDLKAYGYAFGLFITTLLTAFFGTHFNWRMSLISLKMRTGIATAIYRKSLEALFINSDSPEVLNLMSTDTDRIVNSCISFHSFWSIPFQLFTTLYLLYTQIGIAFIGGVVFAIILIPINRWLANRISALSTELLEAKDARVSHTFEALSGAKQIKILAWEDVFINRIEELRERELSALSKRKYLDALCVYFWATTPIIINLLTFGTATLIGQPLTAATTFASVALLNMLIGPLNAFPWVLNGLVEAWISMKRVQSYLDLPDIDFEKFYSPLIESPSRSEPEETKKPVVISLRNASFCFNSFRNITDDSDTNEVQPFIMKSIHGDIKKGDLVCIEGPVGSGKSAFLNAISGNLTRISGYIHMQDIDEGFGYVAQQAWLQHGTIRDNIIWVEIFDESRYRKVIWSCALHKDIEDLGGDSFDIGEGGCTLSGGQKARVALARAVYQDKQIYLIDDVLASLDAHVAKHIVKHCILGILKDRTRVVVTENRTLFYYSNQILRVENGVVSTSDFALGSFDSDYVEDSSEEDPHLSGNFDIDFEENGRAENAVFLEAKETGALSSRVIGAYLKAWGPSLGLFVFLTLFLMQSSKNFSDAWLAHWIMNLSPANSTMHTPRSLLTTDEHADRMIEMVKCVFRRFLLLHESPECAALHGIRSGLTAHEDAEMSSNSFYLSIYIGIAVFNSIVTLLRAFAFAYAGIKAAKYIHTKLLDCVFYAEFSFFDITPLGRILNRFSSDTYTIDDTLPFIMNILLAQLVGLIGALSISLYAMPWLALLVIPMCPIYLNLQWRYRNSSRDIKRLSSNSLSPIYTHFTETIQGLPTIRAMRANHRFHRDFLVKLEDSIRAQLTAASAQQWLGLRLQMLGAFFVGGSGFIAVITSAHSTVPEMVGLVISYSLSITGLLSGVLNALTETEQELVAVERVQNYCKLKSEVNASGSREPSIGWPSQGVVKFDNVSLKYRPYLAPALNQINFQTSPCERIGIVGRTGAGKSTLMAALIRIAQLYTGHVTIDTIDIATVPLRKLRSRIALVPQDSFLFAGTIRENMDPRESHLDSEIWNAINKCLAAPLVQSLGGLDAHLDTRGSNISAGQKQLLCLARALLRRSKIVVIDEGTSNLDSDSENAIQSILRNAFQSSTVLLIAHRLQGLQQTDRVLVIDNGRIVEEGRPQELAQNATTKFYAMLQEQQNMTQTKAKNLV